MFLRELQGMYPSYLLSLHFDHRLPVASSTSLTPNIHPVLFSRKPWTFQGILVHIGNFKDFQKL